MTNRCSGRPDLNFDMDSHRPTLGDIISLGASSGVWIGLLLTCVAGCFFASVYSPLASFLMLPLMAGVPVAAFFFLMRVSRRSEVYCRFSPLWMCGIVMFIAGSLIAAFVSAVYMVYCEPDFLHTYFTNTLDLLKSTGGEMPSSAYDIERYLDSGLLPSPMEFISGMFWASSFFGSVFSLIPAAVIPKLDRKPVNQEKM